MSDDPDSGHPTPRDPDEEPHPPETPKRRGNHRLPHYLQTSTPRLPGRQPPLKDYFPPDETIDGRSLSVESKVLCDRKIRVMIREEQKAHDDEKKKAEETRQLEESMRDDFEAKKRELEDRLDTTVAEKEQLEKEVESTKQREQQLQKEVKGTMQQVTNIRFDLQARNMDLEAAQKAILTKDALILAKEEELAGVRKEKEELQQKLVTYATENKNMGKENAAVSKDLAELKQKNADQVAALETRNTQNLRNQEKENLRWKTEIEELRAKHSREKEELVNQLNSELQARDGEHSEAEKRLHEDNRTLAKSNEQLQSSLAHLQQKQVEAEQYSVQLEKDLTAMKESIFLLEAQLKATKKTCTAKDVELENARVALVQAKNASSVDVQRNEDAHSAEIAALKKEIREWEQKHAHEKKYWETSEAQLRASLQQANRESEQLQKALDDHRSELTSVRTALVEKDPQLRTLQDHIEQLQMEREEWLRERGELYSKVTAHSKGELKLQSEVEDALRERAEHLGKIAELSTEVDRLSEEASRVAQIERECQLERATIEEERREIGQKEATWRRLAEEHEAVKRELGKAEERVKQAQKELEASEKTMKDVEKEKERLRVKNEDLSSMNDLFAQRQLDESTVAEQLRSQYFALQKKHEKVAEKLQSESRKLENAQKKITSLEVDLEMANDRASRKEELERINIQVTQEVEFLRAEVKSRPKGAEFKELADQLDAKEAESEQQARKINEFQEELVDLRRTSNLVDTLQREMRHKEQLLEGFKDQIEAYRKEQDEKHWKMVEALNEKTAIVEEFGHYQSRKEDEMATLLQHVTSLENELVMLKTENRPGSPRFDLEKASVWDAIPVSLRSKIPQEIEGVLRALRVDRSDANSLADSQVAISVAPGIDKLIAVLDEFHQSKLTSTDNTYNILQQVIRLLYNIKSATPDSINGIVERFSADIQQILESKEKKWLTKIERLQNDADYHNRERQAIKRMKNEEEIARADAEKQVRILRLSLEGARKTNEFVSGEKERFKMEAGKLAHELTELRQQHDGLRGESEKMKSIALNALADLKALETDNDEAHELEMNLRGRLRDAEAEKEELKRDGLDLERKLADTKISVDDETTRRIDAERRVADMKSRLAREETTKRVNQDIMRKCIDYIDIWSEFAERLKKRNGQRQRTLDRIHDALKTMERKRGEELWRLLEMDATTMRAEQWKRDDEEDGNGVEALRRNCSAIMLEPKTDMMKDVLANRASACSSRRVENKENRRPM